MGGEEGNGEREQVEGGYEGEEEAMPKNDAVVLRYMATHSGGSTTSTVRVVLKMSEKDTLASLEALKLQGYVSCRKEQERLLWQVTKDGIQAAKRNEPDLEIPDGNYEKKKAGAANTSSNNKNKASAAAPAPTPAPPRTKPKVDEKTWQDNQDRVYQNVCEYPRQMADEIAVQVNLPRNVTNAILYALLKEGHVEKTPQTPPSWLVPCEEEIIEMGAAEEEEEQQLE